MPDEKRQVDPKPLSPEYHKAHKQLMLWASILFIWELVGIDLEKAKESGGNVGAIISAIRSPQAVPWALMILIAYFMFKTTVEWYQCSSKRRLLRAARIDFAMAWLVPITAYALYAFQAIRHVQVADVVQRRGAFAASLFAGFVVGCVLTWVLWTIATNNRARDMLFRRWGSSSWEVAEVRVILRGVTLLSMAAFSSVIPQLVGFEWRGFLWGAATGGAFMFLTASATSTNFRQLVNRVLRRRRQKL
jgi:hypothetical protein